MKSPKTLLGRWGEAQVAQYLNRRGYRLLAADFRCRLGEIDLIVEKRELVAFVEVKLRKDDRFMAAREQVTAAKQRRVRLAAAQFLSLNPQYADRQIRFDVAEVYAPQGAQTQKPKLQYFEQAFE